MPSDIVLVPHPKSIAVVGGGTAGIAALKALLDLPEPTRRNWTIDLFEQREDLGGIWLPDDTPRAPPTLPLSPLYPAMRTNNPHPQMTFPHDPYPAGTNLFPPHSQVRAHLMRFVDKHNLRKFVRFGHEVLDASFEDEHRWTLDVFAAGERKSLQYDHLIIANGHNRYPSRPLFAGEETWAGPTHTIFHSTFYSDPKIYAGRTVIVVGNGASGRDHADRLAAAGTTVYHSWTTNRTGWSPLLTVTNKPRISHFTPSAVHFTDGSTLADSDVTIFLGTGYEVRIPFLPSLAISSNLSAATLTTNLRLVRPLFKHLIPLDPRFPAGSLAIVGLPINVSYCALSYIQSLFVAHIFVNPSMLPSHAEMMADLNADEAKLRSAGHDPLLTGHRFPISGSNEDYQDSLLELLRTRSAVSLPEFLQREGPYVESWRRTLKSDFLNVKVAWELAEARGEAARFLAGEGSERDWVKCVEELREWKRGVDELQAA